MGDEFFKYHISINIYLSKYYVSIYGGNGVFDDILALFIGWDGFFKYQISINIPVQVLRKHFRVERELS